MKTFAYYIGVFVITAFMFAFPILTTLSFCLDWDLSLKVLFTSSTAVDFALVMLAILWCIEDFNDN
jgi:hypothetical protein